MYYDKINGPFFRHKEGSNKGKFIVGQWSEPEFEYLQDNVWNWYEKLDGTNTFVKWECEPGVVSFHGKTRNSVTPKPLAQWFEDTVTPERLNAVLPDTDALIYMEGVGQGIQKVGPMYGDQHGVVIDCKIGNFWLEHYSVRDIATRLGLEYAPYRGEGTLWDAIDAVSDGLQSLVSPGNIAEGLIVRPQHGLLNRAGKRIQTKIKHVDFT